LDYTIDWREQRSVVFTAAGWYQNDPAEADATAASLSDGEMHSVGVTRCMKQFSDPAEVNATSARMRSYKLAQRCPTASTKNNRKLPSVDLTAAFHPGYPPNLKDKYGPRNLSPLSGTVANAAVATRPAVETRRLRLVASLWQKRANGSEPI
jgi:hypothetical protein